MCECERCKKADQEIAKIDGEKASAGATCSISVRSEDELRVLVELLCHSKGAPGFDERISRLREEVVAKWNVRK